MNREPVPGECVVVTRNTGDHPARVGDRFIVCTVDSNDDTVRGIPRGSRTVSDFWIPWSDIEPVAFGWTYVRPFLPPDVAALLAACDGIEYISLDPDIKRQVFDALPDGRERVLEAAEALDDIDF